MEITWVILGLLSKRFPGIEVIFVFTKVCIKFLAFLLYLNKFPGIEVILVDEKTLWKLVASALYLNKFSGMQVWLHMYGLAWRQL